MARRTTRRRWSMAQASASNSVVSGSAFAKFHASPQGRRPAAMPAVRRPPLAGT
jgi:hypothetical protein